MMTTAFPTRSTLARCAALVALLLPLAELKSQVVRSDSARYTCTQPTGGDANRPHPVCEIKPVITRGPYLSAPTDTSATITWMTDLPSHSKVIYGSGNALDREAVPLRHGMTMVATLHSVRLTGLRPGQTYQYKLVSTPVLELNSYWSK